MVRLNINEIIKDYHIINEGYIYRNGFVFTFGQEEPVIFNRIVIRKPECARADETKMGYSYRSLEEHIELINEYQIEKARIMCDDLTFILKCPSLKDVDIFPSYDAQEKFDYSVLYKMPNLKSLYCKTIYGDCGQYKTTLDYSKINGLEELSIEKEGHLGFEKISTIKEIWISENKKIRSLSEVSCSSELQKMTLLGCGIQNLDGIEKHKKIRSLTLWHNYSLRDIAAMSYVSDTLVELSIDACSKIKDFTVLNHLKNLEYLYLEGNNTLPNLEFLKQMNKLKVFIFTMNIEDGDLSNCMNVPYVSCRNRKHYNLKDKELPTHRRLSILSTAEPIFGFGKYKQRTFCRRSRVQYKIPFCSSLFYASAEENSLTILPFFDSIIS